MNHQPLLTAHSGADGTPENSLTFVRYALESGADAIEVDVRREPESGALVLSHDAVGRGTQTLLQQALELTAQHAAVRINCDLKEPGLEQQAAALAGEMGLSGRLIFSGTVDPMRLRGTQIGMEQIYWNIDEQIPELYQRCRREPAWVLQAAEEMCAKCARFGIQTINVYEQLATDGFLDILNRHGIGASVWTVNDPARVRHFLLRGVRNITTRNVIAALAMRQKEGSHAAI
ncbi:MAG: glycerophosphodiester phosphodiesterase [Eubacteriales bacterium]|nr:glycerophosphodiester phosphodiesterase [Eubacteriales bacterium]